MVSELALATCSKSSKLTLSRSATVKDSGVAYVFSVALDVTAGTLLLLLYTAATYKTAAAESSHVGCKFNCQQGR